MLIHLDSDCTPDKILSAKAHVWVNILDFKTLSEIPSHDNGDCWVSNIRDWKKKSAKKPLQLNYLRLITDRVTLSSWTHRPLPGALYSVLFRHHGRRCVKNEKSQ